MTIMITVIFVILFDMTITSIVKARILINLTIETTVRFTAATVIYIGLICSLGV